MLTPGDKLPAINLPDQDERMRRLGDLAGPRGLIIFAYSKDHTSG